MERSMRTLILTALLTVSLFGQNRSAGSARGHSGPPPVMRPVGPPPVARAPIVARPVYPRTFAVPYPVFIGGGYYAPLISGSDYGYAPLPAAVVNQDFQTDAGTPSLIDYSNVSLPEAAPDADATSQLTDDQPTIFLIALTDHSVVACIAYWVDGDTLNWVSRDAKQNRMSLSLVDRDFSKQLNDERHVEFKLPPAK